MFLEKVAAIKREEVDRRKASVSLEEMKEKVSGLPPPGNLLDLLLILPTGESRCVLNLPQRLWLSPADGEHER